MFVKLKKIFTKCLKFQFLTFLAIAGNGKMLKWKVFFWIKFDLIWVLTDFSTVPCKPYSRHFIWNICLMYSYRVYNNQYWIFIIQMKYRLQIMYNHMVGRTASVVSPFYSKLPDPSPSRISYIWFTSCFHFTLHLKVNQIHFCSKTFSFPLKMFKTLFYLCICILY